MCHSNKMLLMALYTLIKHKYNGNYIQNKLAKLVTFMCSIAQLFVVHYHLVKSDICLTCDSRLTFDLTLTFGPQSNLISPLDTLSWSIHLEYLSSSRAGGAQFNGSVPAQHAEGCEFDTHAECVCGFLGIISSMCTYNPDPGFQIMWQRVLICGDQLHSTNMGQGHC